MDDKSRWPRHPSVRHGCVVVTAEDRFDEDDGNGDGAAVCGV